MTLFALMLATAYEGDTLLGIYSSEAAAVAASEGFILAHRPFRVLHGSESFDIREVEIDAAAQQHW